MSFYKTYMIHFGYNNSQQAYLLSGSPITVAYLVKDLGVVVCDTLSWHEYILQTAKKAAMQAAYCTLLNVITH